MKLLNFILLRIYKIFPNFLKDSNLINFFKIVYWKYFLNFKRFLFLKKNRFNLNKEIKRKIKKIYTNIGNNGIDVHNPKNIFNNNDIETLNQIIKLSNNKIEEFENLKSYNDLDKFKQNLKDKGIYKPFRFDLGGYQKFKERNIDTNDFTKINYEILKIGLKEEFLYLASLYLGIYPFLGRFYAWYDFPTNENETSSQCWHKDTDDKKFFKIFIYLNEVTDRNGPFCYIKKTHQSKRRKNIKKYFKKTDYSTFDVLEDNDVNNLYSANDIVECNGSLGTTIFADTSGYHRGKKLQNDKRIMLVFEYFSQSSNFNYDIKFNNMMNETFSKKQLVALSKI
tara:strand:- start:1872 stop:2885 length:1014 start_codon:yes stop_codon:yes gene_type:complete